MFKHTLGPWSITPDGRTIYCGIMDTSTAQTVGHLECFRTADVRVLIEAPTMAALLQQGLTISFTNYPEWSRAVRTLLERIQA